MQHEEFNFLNKRIIKELSHCDENALAREKI
jgi:hypothetical protein